MRITQRAVTLTSMQGLNRNLAAVGSLQERLTSGRSFTTPSESPTGTNQVMRLRGDQRAAEQHARNVSDGKGWLANADTALQTMLTMTQKARNLTLQGKNTGGMSASAQQAIAVEMTGIREALLGVANQVIQGRPLFGGVTGGGVAYDAAGGWVGDASAPVTRRLSDTETVRIDITGPEAFGPAGNDLFAIVDKIAADVVANPAALGGHLDDLDQVMARMQNALADVGARANRVERAEQSISDRLLALQAMRSEVEDIDLPKTIMDLEMQKVGYQAALAATAKAIQPTLMDFLR